MAVSINDKLTQATNGTRPVPTTLTALRTVGAGSITVGALTGWPTATAVHFIIYTIDANSKKVAGSQTDWKGIASGTTISGLVLKGGTDVGNVIGAVVEAAPTAAWCNDLVSWGTAEHNQDGTHAAVTATSVSVAAAGDLNALGVGKLKDNSTSLVTQRTEYFFDYVASGGVWTGDSYGGSLNASMTAMVIYINGRRIAISAVTARAFTLNVDTYIDVLDNLDGTGTLVYTTAATNAASPALASNSVRIGIIQAAATITAATKINQGQEDRVFPIASSVAYSVTDSLGNLICPRDPFRKILGYRQIISAFNTTSLSPTQITGLTVPFLPVANRKHKLTLHIGSSSSSSGGSQAQPDIWEGTVGSGTLRDRGISTSSAAGFPQSPQTEALVTYASSSLVTVNGGLSVNTGGQTLAASSTTPVFLRVELS